MRAHWLRATQKRHFRPHATESRHLCPIAPNPLAERASPSTRPGEVWQANITYVAIREGWLYVAGVLDACSRRVVGWAADAAMPTGLAARSFERAMRGHRHLLGCSAARTAAASTPARRTANYRTSIGSLRA